MSDANVRISTGLSGLDEILRGGLLPRRIYLVSGEPGTGKTTLAWHFLVCGAQAGERTLYVTFSEHADDLTKNAELMGFNVAGVEILDLSPSPEAYVGPEPDDLFTEGDVDRQPTTKRIVEAVERFKPTRIVVDSMTSLRFLTNDTLAYRRQSLAFLRYLTSSAATVLVTSESTDESPDDDLRFLADGVIELGRLDRTWSIQVTKFRGSGSQRGQHGLMVTEHGAVVYPRLLPEEHSAPQHIGQFLPSGLPQLDLMLGGGIDRSSVTLLSGPTGVGKTTLAMQLLHAAARTGLRGVLYSFDERKELLLRRVRQLGGHTDELLANGLLELRSVEPLRYGADEFAQLVRDDVETNGTAVVVIDSTAGYRLTIQGDGLTERVHALARYLQNVGVTVIVLDEIHDITRFSVSDAAVSYLADNVLYLRFIERLINNIPEIRKGIGVLKKRSSDFRKEMREFIIDETGISISAPLAVSSILGAVPSEPREFDR